MCLSNFESLDDDGKEVEGYQIFTHISGICHDALWGSDFYLKGEWSKADMIPGRRNSSISYEPGYHMFLSKEEADAHRQVLGYLSFPICKCKYKGLIGKGTVHSLTSYVYRERMIIEEV